MAEPNTLLSELKAVVGDTYVVHTPEDLIVYEYDGSVDKATPAAVVIPNSTQEVSEVVKLSRRHNTPRIGLEYEVRRFRRFIAFFLSVP